MLHVPAVIEFAAQHNYGVLVLVVLFLRGSELVLEPDALLGHRVERVTEAGLSALHLGEQIREIVALLLRIAKREAKLSDQGL